MKAKKKILPASSYRNEISTAPGIHSIAEPQKMTKERTQIHLRAEFSEKKSGLKSKFK
jgi:hypothetical protein